MSDKIEVCKTCKGTGIEYDGAGHTCTACNGIDTSPPAPVALTERVALLESVLLQVADAFDGGPEHPWIPGYNAKPIFQPVMDAVKDLRSAQSGEPPQ